jgi:undecaprenyl-diphosphatase
MNFLDTLILGIVEGFTEFLPVSSTAHLLVTGEILNIPQTEFFKTFVVVIQLGAILAVILIYWKRVAQNLNLGKKVLTAFIPTAIIGFLLYSVIKNFLFENLKTIAFALIVGGIIILIFEFFQKKKIESDTEKLEDISYKNSFFIGLIQALAIIPGVSRSGATIIGGMGLGISRKNIVEFSFLLAVPTIAAATVYEMLKSPVSFSLTNSTHLLLGFIFSFIFAYISIKFFIRFIQTNSFMIFGFYRILAGVLIIAFLV